LLWLRLATVGGAYECANECVACECANECVGCECANEHSGCVIWGVFIDLLRNCQLFGKDTVPCR